MANHLSDSAREEADFAVLRLIGDEPELSQRQIAAGSGISLGRINYCLAALIDKGLVKIENFKGSRHKLGYIHVLTPSGIAERARLTAAFLERKRAEYDRLAQEIAEIERDLAEGQKRDMDG